MAHKTQFNNLAERPHFPTSEEEIYKFWNEIDAFKQQLELTKDQKPYTFYDGPPFATGLPHYGHICAGTIKDVICRYFAQNGYFVDRRFGWDCHGLPVEYEIDKALGIKHKKDVYAMGIDNYNNECRSIVQRYSKQWKEIIGRCGRWIDFDRGYKTLDTTYMESVWWVFKQLWEKGMVYRGCKVMPYSNACNTVLSNFETQQNYKEVVDPSVYVTFPWVSDPDTKFVAWTTTPWTLPSNLALIVHPEFVYVKVWDKQHNTHFIVAESRLGDLYPASKTAKDSYEIKATMKGSELVGTEYVPLFEYYADRRADGCFRVLADPYVTSDTGTGVVHAAPGFGVDDYRTCVKAGIIKPDDPPVPIDDNGRYYDIISDFKGMYVKDADKEVRKVLRQNGRLLIDSQVRHNYPFCWRSETPLIYKAVHCWFIRVTDIKEDLVKNNKKSHWVPTFAQEGRFNNWLENAEDWCFSRNRFWGNPIPIWVSEDYSECVCIGSIEELERLSGVTGITDLHREFIDKITIPSKTGKGVLRRIDEIFDCWFESGSMPYAQQHYPFSMQEEQFSKIFPADFIAEGIDQTRGWFYTLNVISTALRNDTPYRNLIVNGLVLNHEGKKMSKSKRNYPDPMEVINTYGADAMRLYLINSPLVRAENLNFNEQGVMGIVRDVFLPWYNAYRFLLQNISRYETESKTQFVFDENVSLSGKLSNITDKWIIATEQNLIQKVRHEMEAYRLYTVVPELLQFLDNLTNWYVRINRQRLKGENGLEDQYVSLNVLFDVLFKLTILMSPYVPFITDSFYQNFKKCITSEKYSAQSIHFLQIPQFNPTLIDEKIEQDVLRMQDVIIKARKIRESHSISLKQPISTLTIITTKEAMFQSLTPLIHYIEEEINVNKLLFERDVAQFVELKAEPDNRTCGKELGDKFNKDFISRVRALTQNEIRELQTEGKFTMPVVIQRERKVVAEVVQQQEESKQDVKKGAKKAGKAKKEFDDILDTVTFELKHVVIKESYKTDNLPKHIILSVEDEYSLLMDSTQDDALKKRGLAREFTNRIQKMRKNLKLHLDDDILIFYQIHSPFLQSAVNDEFKSIANQLRKPILEMNYLTPCATILRNAKQEFQIDDLSFTIVISHNTPLFDDAKLNADHGSKLANLIKRTLGAYKVQNLKSQVKDGLFVGTFDGVEVQLKENYHFYLEPNRLYQN